MAGHDLLALGHSTHNAPHRKGGHCGCSVGGQLPGKAAPAVPHVEEAELGDSTPCWRGVSPPSSFMAGPQAASPTRSWGCRSWGCRLLRCRDGSSSSLLSPGFPQR